MNAAYGKIKSKKKIVYSTDKIKGKCHCQRNSSHVKPITCEH